MAIVVAVVATEVPAQVYRCVEAGKTVYSDKPCADPDRSVAVPIVPRTPVPEGASSSNLQLEANLGRVGIGMNKTQVELAWGRPKDVNTSTTSAGTTEQWVYRRDGADRYVYFRGGLVSSISSRTSAATEQVDPMPPAEPAPSLEEQRAAERLMKAGERRLVREGASASQVESSLGMPEARGWSGGLEWWAYSPTAKDHQTRTTIWFDYGRVVKVERTIVR